MTDTNEKTYTQTGNMSDYRHARTRLGVARMEAGPLKHGAASAVKRIQAGKDFSDYQLEKQAEMIEAMNLEAIIEQGGIVGDIGLTLARLATVRELQFDAAIFAASEGNIETWKVYADQYRRFAGKTFEMGLKLLELIQNDDTLDYEQILESQNGNT